jgi:hypothetical protein
MTPSGPLLIWLTPRSPIRTDPGFRQLGSLDIYRPLDTGESWDDMREALRAYLAPSR